MGTGLPKVLVRGQRPLFKIVQLIFLKTIHQPLGMRWVCTLIINNTRKS